MSMFVTIASAPLHLTLGNLGADLQCYSHAGAWITLGHGSDQSGAISSFGKLRFKCQQIVARVANCRCICRSTKSHMPRDYNVGLTHSDSIERLHPYCARISRRV